MRGILNNFNTNSNFWEINPELIVAFKDVYDNDKSSKKEKSSRMMWAIALIYDPDSKFKNLILSERIARIEADFLHDKIVHDSVVSKYIDLVTTPAQRHLIMWNKKMDEKSELLSKLKYDINNWEIIEKMLAGNTKLYSELERIQDMLSKEGSDGVSRGGSMESASEGGLL